MIHLYNQMYVQQEMTMAGDMFQRVVVAEYINIDEFADMFISSGVAGAFETADLV